MKARYGYYFWILSLAAVLMLLILAAQVFTIKNINGLKTGNREAAITFTINNRLQEVVNTSAILEKRLTRDNAAKKDVAAVKDSLTVMGYNASVLEKLNVDTATRNNFKKLNAYISRQVIVSFNILDAIAFEKPSEKNIYTDSLSQLKLSDSIYETAIGIENGLELGLKKTFDQNTVASQKISTLNKLFALIAIAAILILGTIIINRHLRQASLIKALEKANAEVKKSAMIKEQFLANMSHEIRTPLNAIKGFSRLMSQTKLDDEQRKFSDIIENSSNNLLHLVNDILDIAKIEAGGMVVDQKEFDLKRMMQTLEFMFMNTAKEKQLELSWHIEEEVPQYLVGDADRIYQILINLVSNAFKFTSKGFINLSVLKLSETEEEITVAFRVEDTGIGIPLKKQELIFERFQQINDENKNIKNGTGLGLAIVKNMALLLGGSVTVNSIEGQGSVFTVMLPFPKNRPAEEVLSGNEIPEKGDVEFTGAKVLVAEDNKVNQLLISQLLQSYHIQPVIKENGLEVLEILDTQQFDLVLLDIQMPLLDGYKTCAAIRKSGLGLPVVAMTAYVMEAEKEKCRSAGMNGYLAKPLDEPELRKVLEKYLHQFIKQKPAAQVGNNEFLLQLAGGDEQMAGIILKEVIREIPAEIEKLKNVVSIKNTSGLAAICHHLVSSISPLGNESSVMKKITGLQKSLAEKKPETAILENTGLLITELEATLSNLVTIKPV
ncbi:MAG: ATP-binding protein [Ferruginibacter sp.]